MNPIFDSKIMGLALAVSYPDEAFAHADPDLQARCASLIRRAGSGEDVALEVSVLLEEDPVLNEWVEIVQEDPQGRPPHLQPDYVRSYSPMRNPEPMPSTRFLCPRDGLRWFRRTVAEQPPPCPLCASELQAG